MEDVEVMQCDKVDVFFDEIGGEEMSSYVRCIPR